MEIERKFLVNDISNLELSKYKHKQIVQDYLYKDLYTIVRKRKIVDENNNITYKYTIKTNKVGISVNEIEKEITKSEYEKLGINSKYNTINKIRYIIPIENNLKIELDVFKEEFEGIVFAEIEFEDECQAKSISLPEWFGSEISNEITNSDMASMPVSIIFQKIRDFKS